MKIFVAFTKMPFYTDTAKQGVKNLAILIDGILVAVH